MYPRRARVEKKKLMKSPSRTLIHGVIAIVGLALSSTRIRAASAIARDDHDTTNDQETTTLRTWRAGFAGRADRAVPRPTAGSNTRRFDLSTGSNSASAVDESTTRICKAKHWRTQWQSSRGTQASSHWWSFQTWFSGWPAIFNGPRIWETHSWRSNLT